jgi:hypothetical protein
MVEQVRDSRPQRPVLASSNPQLFCPPDVSIAPAGGVVLAFLQSFLEALMTDANSATRPKRARSTRAQRILASLIAGAGVDEIGAAERLTRKRTESILRQELRSRWVAPAEDFARLQIARLEQMLLKLLDRLQNGDLKAIDRAIRIVDRLDRYHGFTKAKRLPEQYGDEDRARLLKKINEVAERLQPEKPAE